MRYIESYEQRNGINDYEHFGALKGIPKKSRNPETIKLKLIQKSIKILKSKGLSSRDMETITTLIWDISTAGYEQGVEQNER
mgnify:FL=1